MASAQDYAPVVKELSERPPQDPQPSQAEQPQRTQQQTPPKVQDLPDLPRPVTAGSEPPREPSPPRFSQLLLQATGSHPSRRNTSTTTTDPSTLVNHPGTVSSGVPSSPVIQDRNHPQLTSLLPDRRPSVFYDPAPGGSPVHVPLPDDGEHDHRDTMRRVSLPQPRPVFSPLQDGGGRGDGNGSRVALRAIPGLDWIPDPHQLQHLGPKMVQERLQPTHDAATRERDKYKKKARQQSLMINGAIGLQVITGAITTGVAAASKNIGPAVAVLGGISTALASYLAKARGSGEPEFSSLRARELSTFIRDIDAFIMDNGHKAGLEFDQQISMFRGRFELIIKTEGEDSTSGTGYATHPHPSRSANFHPANQQAMAGTFDGRNFQAMPPRADGGNGQLSEKQMWKNEKALGGMV